MRKTVDVVPARLGGRPKREEAGKIRDAILDVASGLFFSQGYGATSVEAIASAARVSKRTFYSRFNDKADVFRAVVERVVERLRPPELTRAPDGKDCEETLRLVASGMLGATLKPEALALYRLILAEAARFPELVELANAQGVRGKAVKRIADLLRSEGKACRLNVPDPQFAAEQFIQMVISFPQRRALMFGEIMSAREIEAWARDTVRLFLGGCRIR